MMKIDFFNPGDPHFEFALFSRNRHKEFLRIMALRQARSYFENALAF
jgi:hypothetical protein